MKQFVISLFILSIFSHCCTFKPYPTKAKPQPKTNSSEKRVAISIVSHGWHTGFVIPSKELFGYYPKLGTRFANTRLLEIGWGDKGFYQADGVTFGIAVRAIFWPSDSVLHIVSVPTTAFNYFPHSKIKKVHLTRSKYLSLVKFIADSFATKKNGEIISLREGIYGDSQFYTGTGSYHLWNTCNTWTAKGLKSAGKDIYVPTKLTAGSIMDFLGED
ncbi:MAG: TIGR02117 family protein [Spirochaetota bacterium]